MVRNNVQLNVTEYLDNVYGVQFGVQHPVTGTTVWGTYCPLDDALWSDFHAQAIANAVCSQITGVLPYALLASIGSTRSYSFLPPPDVRRDMPAVLSRLDCGIVAGGVPANISLCSAEASEPLPMPPTLACIQYGDWTNKLISCQPKLFWLAPRLGSVRLVGGANSSYGRLEVINQETLDRGWGTVCAPGFDQEHAQAVCRDLGLPWTQAAVLPASAVPQAPPSQLIALDDIYCRQHWWPTADVHPPLSFARDCMRIWQGSLLRTCGYDADVGVACSGEVIMPLPPSPPSPVYGGYGGPPPPVYGPYGGYGGPPAYGIYAQS
ncbi:Deleted in malignant brain tumors 1 protein [Tetrabaena socialis]|uniref:Deleted in malignant brain tumors 1 protein n=1 Tax=Tetrabaena socialis TaxID=47790 RepID=A0A2J7ZZH7_9CHLO|nr:Deleted in malignant brain tumors 1 protein [Tetrabaena socialis]|eukprot:PNH05648.1 Deleted in malignant brain tumors 1 protein [Tetrabaena socialis]